MVAHWVTSAKQEDTRARRLAQLIDVSARGEKPGVFRVEKKRKT
jgi:hypothetical protein